MVLVANPSIPLTKKVRGAVRRQTVSFRFRENPTRERDLRSRRTAEVQPCRLRTRSGGSTARTISPGARCAPTGDGSELLLEAVHSDARHDPEYGLGIGGCPGEPRAEQGFACRTEPSRLREARLAATGEIVRSSRGAAG